MVSDLSQFRYFLACGTWKQKEIDITRYFKENQLKSQNFATTLLRNLPQLIKSAWQKVFYTMLP